MNKQNINRLALKSTLKYFSSLSDYLKCFYSLSLRTDGRDVYNKVVSVIGNLIHTYSFINVMTNSKGNFGSSVLPKETLACE